MNAFKYLVLAGLASSVSWGVNAQDLLPKDVVVEAYQGDWRRGGSDPTKECLNYFNQKYPTARIQVVDTGEESKRDMLGKVEYKYRCTVVVKKP